MIILVGLGNPGKVFLKTRHNVGFMVIDSIISNFNFSEKCLYKSHVQYSNRDFANVKLIKPSLFMNSSGKAIKKIPFKNIKDLLLVFHDELDLELGKVKLKEKGSCNGHKGLISISNVIGNEFKRIQIGIGRPPDKRTVPKYVLEEFTPEEFEICTIIINRMIKNMELLFGEDIKGFYKKVRNEN